MKKWKCTVCNYVHQGDEPPEKCPVCGADKNKFIIIEEEQVKTEVPENEKESLSQGKKEKSLKSIFGIVTKFHLHPISVHMPNGVIPVALGLAGLGVVFNSSALAMAAAFNIIFVFLSMPVVLFTGYVEWRERYKTAMTPLFTTKIVCGSIIAFFTAVITFWYMISSHSMIDSENGRLYLFFMLVLMAGTAGVAGHLGGKLVFKE